MDSSSSVRSYRSPDRESVCRIYGDDEFARPELQHRFPRMSAYLADSMSHYYDLEPESVLVAELDGQVVGAVLGAVNTERTEERLRQNIIPLLRKRTLAGAYGWPAWLWADGLTHLAGLRIDYPRVDLSKYPAHLHIGILPAWRRQGVGAALMNGYEQDLRNRGIPGYHLHASSFHPMGVAFYRKIGLDPIGQFGWRFHNGYRWVDVVETVFARGL